MLRYFESATDRTPRGEFSLKSGSVELTPEPLSFVVKPIMGRKFQVLPQGRNQSVVLCDISAIGSIARGINKLRCAAHGSR